MRTVVARHRVHHAADCVAAIEKCCGTLDHFNSLNGQDVNRFGVIAGFKSETADAVAVLQNKHSVAVKPADYRPRSTRAETSFGYTEFTIKRLTK
jgi:hypothetical protein